MNADKPLILVVDDTTDNIDVLRETLRGSYRIKAATNGEKALAIAAADTRPDLILLDVMMPGMDGYEVCKRLKSDPTTRDIPIIFITALSQVADEQRGFELGAVDYITKPLVPPIVQSRVCAQLALAFQTKRLKEENTRLRERAEQVFRPYSDAELHCLIGSGEGARLEFKSTLRWNSLLKAHIGPELIHLIRSEVVSIEGQRILVVQCLSAKRPVFFRRDNDEAFFIRTGNGTQELRPSEVLAYVEQRS